jgi:hypothetical protein
MKRFFSGFLFLAKGLQMSFTPPSHEDPTSDISEGNVTSRQNPHDQESPDLDQRCANPAQE